MGKPTAIDLAIIEKAEKISEGWITVDRWLRIAYFGQRYFAKSENVADVKIKPSRVYRLLKLGLLKHIEVKGSHAFYRIVKKGGVQ